MKKKKAAKKTKRVYNKWKKTLKKVADGTLHGAAVYNWAMFGYSSSNSCYQSLTKLVRFHGLPLQVYVEGDIIYIQKI